MIFKKSVLYDEKFQLEIEPNTTNEYGLHIFGDNHVLVRKISCMVSCKDVERKVFELKVCNYSKAINIFTNMVEYNSQTKIECNFDPGQQICAKGLISFTLRNLSNSKIKVKIRTEGLQSGRA